MVRVSLVEACQVGSTGRPLLGDRLSRGEVSVEFGDEVMASPGSLGKQDQTGQNSGPCTCSESRATPVASAVREVLSASVGHLAAQIEGAIFGA